MEREKVQAIKQESPDSKKTPKKEKDNTQITLKTNENTSDKQIVLTTQKKQSSEQKKNTTQNETEKQNEAVKQKKATKQKNVTQKKTMSRKQKVIAFLIWTISLTIVILTAIGVLSFFGEASDANSLLSKYIAESPTLIFNRLSFYKYLVHGSPDGTDDHLDQLSIIHATGTADFSFDLTKLSIVSTDLFSRSITLQFDDKSYFPVDVIVNFDTLTEVASIEPQSVTEKEAAFAGKVAAATVGTAGTLLGAKAGAAVSSGTSIGSSILMLLTGNPLGLAGTVASLGGVNALSKLTGGAIGGTVGGVAGASAGYLMTKNFLTGFTVSGNSLGETEKLADTSKVLIALELMTSGDTIDSVKQLAMAQAVDDGKIATDLWGKTTQDYYRNELLESISDFFQAFGWKNITITFTGGDKPLSEVQE